MEAVLNSSRPSQSLLFLHFWFFPAPTKLKTTPVKKNTAKKQVLIQFWFWNNEKYSKKTNYNLISILKKLLKRYAPFSWVQQLSIGFNRIGFHRIYLEATFNLIWFYLTLYCLAVIKGHTYLNKPTAFSCRFVKVCIAFCYHRALKN